MSRTSDHGSSSSRANNFTAQAESSKYRFPRPYLVAAIIFPHTKWLPKITDYRDTAALIPAKSAESQNPKILYSQIILVEIRFLRLEEKMLGWIIARMERKAFVFQKKKKRVPGVIFEALWRGAWMDGLCIATDLPSVRHCDKSRSKPNKHTISRTDTGIRLQFIFLFLFVGYSPLGSFQNK